MDPFARRMLQGTLIYGGVMLLMFAVLTVVYLHTRPRCSDQLVAQTPGPGGQAIATVMERRCGEDTPFFTHVNLRPAGADVQRGFFSGSATEGEVFVVEQDAAGAGLTVEWSAADTLLVRCPRCNPSFLREHQDRWQTITIKYELPSR
jgi:hypothetical protein